MSRLKIWIIAIIGSIIYFYLLDLVVMKAYFGNTLGLNLFPK